MTHTCNLYSFVRLYCSFVRLHRRMIREITQSDRDEEEQKVPGDGARDQSVVGCDRWIWIPCLPVDHLQRAQPHRWQARAHAWFGNPWTTGKTTGHKSVVKQYCSA